MKLMVIKDRYCGYSDETFRFNKGGKFLNHLNNCQPFKKYVAWC
jgi:hypothetical protein